MKEKRKIRYWIKWMIKDPKDFRGYLSELTYILKRKHDPRCLLGMHKPEMSITWYYEPDWYCARCDEQDALNWRNRYVFWASVHTMHPVAWPFVIISSVQYWWDDRTHNE
jgi:hypothetical protein